MEEARFVVKTELDTPCFRELVKCSGMWRRWVDAGLALLMWAMTVLMWKYGIWYEESLLRWCYVLLALLMTALAVFYVPFYAWISKRRSRSKIGEVTYIFLDNDYRTESAMQSSTSKYDSVMELKATKKCYFLYIQKKAAYVLPKERFVEGDADAFAAFIEGKTGLKLKNVRG